MTRRLFFCFGAIRVPLLCRSGEDIPNSLRPAWQTALLLRSSGTPRHANDVFLGRLFALRERCRISHARLPWRTKYSGKLGRRGPFRAEKNFLNHHALMLL